MSCNDQKDLRDVDQELIDQYVLTEYDNTYTTVGPFKSVREAKAFASGIEFVSNEDMRVLGIVTRNQLLVEANVEAPVYLSK